MKTRSFPVDPEDLKLIHPFTCIISGPSQSGKSYFALQLIDNLPKLTTPPICSVIYIYNIWQDKFDSYKDKVLFTTDLKYITFKPDKPTLLICDDQMDEVGGSKELKNLFTKYSHHNDISAILILQNIFETGSIFVTLKRNTHYFYLTEHLCDRRSVDDFGRKLESQADFDYFKKSYDHAVKRKWGGMFVDVHPASKMRKISKYRADIHKFVGQTLYINPKNM